MREPGEALLQEARRHYVPPTPLRLRNLTRLDFVPASSGAQPPQPIVDLFPHLAARPPLRVVEGAMRSSSPLRVGVVLSGGQAAGGHNAITGLFDALRSFRRESVLIGFLNGPTGIVKNTTRELTEEVLLPYRNQGGFDLLGAGRTKIETPEQFADAMKTVQAHALDGLVIIGGDDSNTNAAYLAEYFLAHSCTTAVIGIPKTIDGDLQSADIEIPFGFDTACKVYSESIGNIARDALSNKKYYYCIKLMGRSASHIALECALQTHPNLTFIGEELLASNRSLTSVVQEMAGVVQERIAAGKEYGVILIPEGVIEFLSDMRQLVEECNRNPEAVPSGLTGEAKACWELLPQEIQQQLLLDRDPHGNIQVSKIETERLFIALVSEELKRRGVKASFQPIFCGYEARSALPSNFDATYSTSLGRLAALLIERKHTGYIAAITKLRKSNEEWEPMAVPIVPLLHFEERGGVQKAVIEKTLVKLQGEPFKRFARKRGEWRLEDDYLQPGPIQFFGPPELTDGITHTLELR